MRSITSLLFKYESSALGPSSLDYTPLGDQVANGSSSRANREIELALVEYENARKEEIAGLHSQISTLRYGITGCVVLIGIAAQQHNDRYLGWALALALIPLVILFSAVIWMGEYERMAQAGHYVGILERRINRKLGSPSGGPLGWEKWLHEGSNAQSRIVGGQHRYLAIASIFLGLHLTAVAMGLHFYWHKHATDPSHKWMIPTAVVINVAIMLTLIGYFRSSYERLRDLTSGPDERGPVVRQRLRMRLRMYGVFLAVGFLSAPIWSWPLGVYGVRALNHTGVVGHVPSYWIATPVLIWMVIVPLVASRGVMRELLSTRTQTDTKIGDFDRQRLERSGILSDLMDWEREHLNVVPSEALNAPSIGRGRSIAITAGALANESELPGVLAHEVGHRRLHHLHPLALSYLYLWPYFYYDDKVTRRTTRAEGSTLRRAARHAARAAFTLVEFPGWLAWVVLRYGWRTAEYDADRYAYLSGNGPALAAALLRHEQWRHSRHPRGRARFVKGWERVAQGRALGYLPVPNEHPAPERRLKHLKSWTWTRMNE